MNSKHRGRVQQVRDIHLCGSKDLSMYDPIKILPDGRGIWIDPLTFGRARINIGPVDSACYDDGW